MSVNQIFTTFVVIFVLLSGGLGYWVYDLYESLDNLDVEAKSKSAIYQVSQRKVMKVTQLEDKKSKLEVRRNEIEEAVPMEGSQSSMDIMAIIDDLKNHVEANDVQFPLLITEQGVVDGLKSAKVVTSRRSRSRKKVSKSYKPIQVKISVKTTWLGLLRFIDLLEDHKQIFSITSVSGTKEKKITNSRLESPEQYQRNSPFKYPFYTNAKLTITTHHLRSDKKK